MKAITFTQTGSPDVLRLTDVALPTPGPEQLLVRVHATALNRVDLLQRRGKYPAPPGESEILGVEIAGEVTAMGENVTGFAMGDRGLWFSRWWRVCRILCHGSIHGNAHSRAVVLYRSRCSAGSFLNGK